jgi:hypothetical protein
MKLKRIRKIALRFMQAQVLPAVLLCSATSLVVLVSTTALFATAPFVPDGQEEAIKKVALDFSTPLLGSAIWLLGAMVICTQLENWELEDQADQAEQRYLARLGEIEDRRQQPEASGESSRDSCKTAQDVSKPLVTDTSCIRCKYWAGGNEQVIQYLKYPCSVYPMGRPGEQCSDWEEMMLCPNCQSERLYRTDSTSLKVRCEACNHHFQAKQPLKPLLSKRVWKSKPPIGNHQIDVWLCPTDESKYSFAYTFQNSLPYLFNEYQSDCYLSGCYDTPEAALQAGIEQI